MILTRLGHAALLIETTKTRLLIDPGGFSDLWHDLTDLDAILITHQHADHIDTANFAKVAGGNPDARIVVEPAVAPMIPDHEAQTAHVSEIIAIGDVTIEVVGGEHAIIHESIPRVGNVGFVINETEGTRLFHPGDSYATAPRGIDLLALPLTAPWARVGMTIDFANEVRPARMFPIHDAIVSEKGRPVYMRMCTEQSDEAITFDDPPIGEPYQV